MLPVDVESSEMLPQKKKVDKKSTAGSVGMKLYGADFDGQFQRVGEIVELLPAFKEFYFAKRKENLQCTVMSILVDFNKKVTPMKFYPYPAQYRGWRVKWDIIVLHELGLMEYTNGGERRLREALRLRSKENDAYVAPHEDELEMASRTLGGYLVNDALNQLQDDKEIEDAYTSDELIKRKAYALNVFQHVTKFVQGKENIKIKKQAEGRETAGFMMGLITRAVSGQMSNEELALLHTSITPTTHELTPSQPA